MPPVLWDMVEGERTESRPQEQQVTNTFVELADTLVGDYEVSAFLQFLSVRCTEILQADTAGVLLESGDGHLELAGAVSDDMYDIEQVEMDSGKGRASTPTAPGGR